MKKIYVILLMILIPIVCFSQTRGFVFGLSVPNIAIKKDNSNDSTNKLYGLGGKIGIENWIFELSISYYHSFHNESIVKSYNSITSEFDDERKLIYELLFRFNPRKLITPYVALDFGNTNLTNNELSFRGKSYGMSLGLERNFLTDKYSYLIKSFSIHLELKYSYNYFDKAKLNKNEYTLKDKDEYHMLMLSIELRKIVDFDLLGY